MPVTERDGAHLKPMSPTVRPPRAWNGTDSPPAPGWLLSASVAGSGWGSERGMVLRIAAANSSPVVSGCTVMRAVPAGERIRSSCGGQRWRRWGWGRGRKKLTMVCVLERHLSMIDNNHLDYIHTSAITSHVMQTRITPSVNK